MSNKTGFMRSVVVLGLSVFLLCGCSGVGGRATRTGPAPIATAAAPSDPWAAVAPEVNAGDGVSLPPDTALPVRKGR
ncbi:MAG: hypothetical protein N2111_00345 [Candidatus Sumerlaeaceae bacterium]|nr:hypothetical protein [Candidatus Sumerlaeaceae bacterium]